MVYNASKLFELDLCYLKVVYDGKGVCWMWFVSIKY